MSGMDVNYDDMDQLDEDLQEEMMQLAGGGGGAGGQRGAQAAMELFAKRLLHKDFYNDFTDDCDEDELDS